jgi:hypothetical protein
MLFLVLGLFPFSPSAFAVVPDPLVKVRYVNGAEIELREDTTSSNYYDGIDFHQAYVNPDTTQIELYLPAGTTIVDPNWTVEFLFEAAGWYTFDLSDYALYGVNGINFEYPGLPPGSLEGYYLFGDAAFTWTVVIATVEEVNADTADKTALQAAIDVDVSVSHYTEGDRWNGREYLDTVTSYESFYRDYLTVLDKAKKVNGDPYAEQETVDAATRALTAAAARLIPRAQVNATRLYEVITAVLLIQQIGDCTAVSHALLDAALRPAQEVLDQLFDDDGNATAYNIAANQDAVDAAVASFDEPFSKVVNVSQLPSYAHFKDNVDGLNRLTAGLSPSDYTAESWAAFDAARRAMADYRKANGDLNAETTLREHMNAYRDLAIAYHNSYYKGLKSDADEITVKLRVTDDMGARHPGMALTDASTAWFEESITLTGGNHSLRDLFDAAGLDWNKAGSDPGPSPPPSLARSIGYFVNGVLMSEWGVGVLQQAWQGELGYLYSEDRVPSHPYFVDFSEVFLRDGDEIVIAHVESPQHREYYWNLRVGQADFGMFFDALNFLTIAGDRVIEASEGESITLNVKQAKAYLGAYTGIASNAPDVSLFASEPADSADAIPAGVTAVGAITDASGQASFALYAAGWYRVQATNATPYDYDNQVYDGLSAGDSILVHILPLDEAELAAQKIAYLSRLSALFADYDEAWFDAADWAEAQSVYNTAYETIEQAASLQAAADALNAATPAFQALKAKAEAATDKKLTTLTNALYRLPTAVETAEGRFTQGDIAWMNSAKTTYDGMTAYQRTLLTRSQAEQYAALAEAFGTDGSHLPEARQYNLNITIEPAELANFCHVRYNQTAHNGPGDSKTMAANVDHYFSGGNSLVLPFSPADGFSLRFSAYSSDREPIAYEIASVEWSGTDAMKFFIADFTLVEGYSLVTPRNDVNVTVSVREKPNAALTNAKTNAKTALDSAFALYGKNDYTAENWNALVAAYKAGLAAIDEAAEQSAVVSAREAGIAGMDAVPKRGAQDYGTVYVTVENTTTEVDSEAFQDVFIDGVAVPLTDETTMMSAVMGALDSAGYTCATGSDGNYIKSISKDGVTLDDGGSGGIMGTLNGYFVEESFAAFDVANGRLRDGDVICVMFTKNLGVDLGGSWQSSDTRLKSLLSSGELIGEFDPSGSKHIVHIGDAKGTTSFVPEAQNKFYQVRIFLNATGGKNWYRPFEQMPVTGGDVVTIGVGGSEVNGATVTKWPSMLIAEGINYTGTYYTFYVISADGGSNHAIALIGALPTNVAESDRADVEFARTLYDALSSDEQAKVTNLSKLTGAEAKLASLSGVTNVKAAIEAIPRVVNEDAREAVLRAQAAYVGLSEAERRTLTIAATDKLNAALRALGLDENAAPIKLTGLGLTAKGLGGFVFGDAVFEYSDITVARDAETLTIAPSAAEGQTITVDGTPVASGGEIQVPLQKDAPTVITILVNDAVHYTITLNREPIAALTGLTLNADGFEFAPETMHYAVDVPSNRTTLTVTPTFPNGLTVTVNGLTVASGVSANVPLNANGSATTLTITVTAYSGQSASYTIAVDRAAAQVLPYEQALGDVLAYIGSAVENPQYDSVGGEWAVLALARANALSASAKQNYLSNLAAAAVDGASNGDVTVADGKVVMHPSRYTENERVILALTSLGIDASNWNGLDFVSALADRQADGEFKAVWQGINGAVFALIALDSNAYLTQSVRDEYVRYLLAHRDGDGWSLNGASKTDLTAMAIQALAPYYGKGNQILDAAVDDALTYLSGMQSDDGVIGSCEGTAQAVVALASLKIDANTDSRFVKNGRGALDGLLNFRNADGSFRHLIGADGADQMSTEQAAYALVAYDRYVKGEKSLYDMAGANKTLLNALIEGARELAEALSQVGDAEASQVLTEALSAAETIAQSAFAVQTEVDSAKDALVDALKTIVPDAEAARLTLLYSMVDHVGNKLAETDYTPSAWLRLTNALAAAETAIAAAEAESVAAREQNTEVQYVSEEPEEPAESIESAKAEENAEAETETGEGVASTPIESEGTEDPNGAVESAETIESEAARTESEETAAEAETARTEPEETAAEPETFETTDALRTADLPTAVTFGGPTALETAREATLVLLDAVKALARVETEPTIVANKTALNAEIAKAEGLNRDSYTEASRNALQAALAAAKAIAANASAGQTQIDDAKAALTAAINALVTIGSSPGVSNDSIGVSFRLIGATLASEDVDISNGINDSKYVTWIPTSSYTLPKSATVYDLFVTALAGAGLQAVGQDKNYVKTIYAPGVLDGYALSEFTNGKYSGWMYTVNGSHPGYGLKEQALKDGDRVIWHYVNDYRHEVQDWFDDLDYPALGDGSQWNKWLLSSDVWPTSADKTSSPGADAAGTDKTAAGGGDGSIVASVTVESKTALDADTGKATVALETESVSKAVEEAVKAVEAAKAEGKTDAVAEIRIVAKASAETAEAVRIAETEIPAEAIKAVADAKSLVLTVESDVSTVSFDAAALAGLAIETQSGETVKIVAEAIDTAEALNARQIEKAGDSPVIELSVTVGSTTISDFRGTVTVSVPYTPKAETAASDYDLLTVYFLDDAGNIEEMKGAKYDAKTGLITFTTDHFSKFFVSEWISPFADIEKGDWFYKSVRFAYANGLVNGTDEGAFSPQTNLTRAMLITILAREAGADTEGGETWYAKAVEWGVAEGITDGTNPADNVTREQFAAILYRCAGSPAQTGTLAAYADAGDVSAWATDAMVWAVENGILTGRTETELAPKGAATRAEAAALLMRFIEGAA